MGALLLEDDGTSHTCSLYVSQRRLDGEAVQRYPPPPLPDPHPILSFCSISFITVSWLRNRPIVRVLDGEGQQ